MSYTMDHEGDLRQSYLDFGHLAEEVVTTGMQEKAPAVTHLTFPL